MPEPNEQQGLKRRVAIIGAGASGLQCAHALLQEDPDASLIILEGRDRIGGRIHSVAQEKTRQDGSKVRFVLDNGAAWVHGTGYDWPTLHNQEEEEKKQQEEDDEENPMMSLLQQVTPSRQNVCTTHLKPVFELGNPWIRPQFVVHNQNNMALFVAGNRIDNDSPVIEKALDRHYEIMEDVSKIGTDMFDSGNGMDTVHESLGQTVAKIAKGKRMKKKKQWFKKRKGEEQLVESLVPLYRHLIECWYACPTSEMQLGYFVESDNDNESTSRSSQSTEWDEEYCKDGDFYGPHCTVRNGMKTVLEPLLTDAVSDKIRCNQEVISIREQQDDNTVLLKTATGLEVEADVCVVTLSVGCLQYAIETSDMFEPPMCDEKREAIKARRMGGYKKIFLTFDRIFWPADEPFVGLVRRVMSSKNNHDDKEFGNYLLLDNLWAKDGIPCIEAVLCGFSNTWAMHKSDDQVRDAVLEFMQDAMEGELSLKDWCVDCHVTRWEEDKFSRGAYSSYQLGTCERHAEELCKPEWGGKLVFAGEAGEPEHEGSVHGALFSGLHAAEKVQAALSKTEMTA